MLKDLFTHWSYNMKLIFVFILSLSLLNCSTPAVHAPSEGVANVYMRDDLYPQFKAQLPDFPAKGSAAQKADEAELFRLQKSRRPEECKRAAAEVVVTLQNLYGLPYGELSEKQVTILLPLFAQIRNDGGAYIGQAKRDYA
jgi:hypothetical protein